MNAPDDEHIFLGIGRIRIKSGFMEHCECKTCFLGPGKFRYVHRDGLWNTSWDAADRETLRSIGVQQGAQRSLDAVKKEISHKE